jgi:hypothetical protein
MGNVGPPGGGKECTGEHTGRRQFSQAEHVGQIAWVGVVCAVMVAISPSCRARLSIARDRQEIVRKAAAHEGGMSAEE